MLAVVSEQEQIRQVGVDALKALAHPLRVRLYSELTAYGPATASALAARLGESSGATSYHLRQLEKHGFVREDPERGNARDRWWERVPGPIELADAMFGAVPAAREAGDLVEMEFVRLENERFSRYWAARSAVPPEWQRVSGTSSANLRLTPDELDALSDELFAVIARYRGREGDEPDRRRVEIQYRNFPVVEPAAPEPAEADGGAP